MVRAEQGGQSVWFFCQCFLIPPKAARSDAEGKKGGEEGKATHINHMKLLLDIRARLQGWTGLGDQQCDAVRLRLVAICDLMAVERWDQLTCEVCCEYGLAWGMRRGAMDNILGRRVGKEEQVQKVREEHGSIGEDKQPARGGRKVG